jgi:hypothetical protein
MSTRDLKLLLNYLQRELSNLIIVLASGCLLSFISRGRGQGDKRRDCLKEVMRVVMREDYY